MNKAILKVLNQAEDHARLFARSKRDRFILWIDHTNKGRAVNRLAFFASGFALAWFIRG